MGVLFFLAAAPPLLLPLSPTFLLPIQIQSMTVTGLSSNAAYYFAMKTSDEAPNVSGISNVVSETTTGDTTPPSAPMGDTVD